MVFRRWLHIIVLSALIFGVSFALGVVYQHTHISDTYWWLAAVPWSWVEALLVAWGVERIFRKRKDPRKAWDFRAGVWIGIGAGLALFAGTGWPKHDIGINMLTVLILASSALIVGGIMHGPAKGWVYWLRGTNYYLPWNW